MLRHAGQQPADGGSAGFPPVPVSRFVFRAAAFRITAFRTGASGRRRRASPQGTGKLQNRQDDIVFIFQHDLQLLSAELLRFDQSGGKKKYGTEQIHYSSVPYFLSTLFFQAMGAIIFRSQRR